MKDNKNVTALSDDKLEAVSGGGVMINGKSCEYVKVKHDAKGFYYPDPNSSSYQLKRGELWPLLESRGDWLKIERSDITLYILNNEYFFKLL